MRMYCKAPTRSQGRVAAVMALCRTLGTSDGGGGDDDACYYYYYYYCYRYYFTGLAWVVLIDGEKKEG